MSRDDFVVWEESAPWYGWVAALLYLAVGTGAVVALSAGLGELLNGNFGAFAESLLAATLVVGVGLAIRTGFGRLKVTVTRTSVLLTYGYTRLLQKLVLFDEIEEVRAVRYKPLREFLGWGIRWGTAGKRAWTIRGDGAVVLTLTDGTRFYVGSDEPRRLAEEIRNAMTALRRKRGREREEEAASRKPGDRDGRGRGGGSGTTARESDDSGPGGYG